MRWGRARNPKREIRLPEPDGPDVPAADAPRPGLDPQGRSAWGIAAVSAVSPGGIGVGPLLYDPTSSTPLEAEGPGDLVPAAPLWAMKDRKHTHRLLEPDDPGRVSGALGEGDTTLYVIDDGPDHCMIARQVGRSPDGCVYCLVGRIGRFGYEQLCDGEVALTDAFDEARDICLCGVFESEPTASNVILVQHYRGVGSVPDEYLPPGPFLDFAEAVDGG